MKAFPVQRFSNRERDLRTKPWGFVSKLITLVLCIQVTSIEAYNNSDPRKDIGNETSANHNADNQHITHQQIGITEELRQGVLHQFDAISADLKELAYLFRSNDDTNRPRVVRSLPIDESPVCEVEQATFIRFRDELRATLNGTNQAGNSTCPLNFNSDKCEELFNLVLCGYDHLKNGFIVATGNIVARDEAIKLKNTLTEFQEKSSKLFDAKITSVSQKYELEIQRLKTDMQVLQNLLTKIVDDLDAQTVKSCISEIASGQIDSAAADFKKLNNDSKLEHIVSSVYLRYGQLDQVHNLVKFIKKLPTCAQDKRALPVLVDEMRKNNFLTAPKVLLVSSAAKACMTSTALDIELETYTRPILDAWASKIRTNDYEQVKEFAKNYTDLFRKYLPNLIDKAYTSLSNAEVMILFIRNLPYIEDSIVSYSSLFDKMKSNGDLDSYQVLMLAYRVKEYMNMANYPKVEQDNKNKFTTLKNNLPSLIRDLIWNGHCYIKNEHYGEYLYVTSAGGGYSPQTWVPGNAFPDAFWNFEPHENGRYFKIKQTTYNKYLGLSNSKHNDERRLATTTDPSSKEWTLIPEGNTLLFKDRQHHDYLYADYNKRDSQMRHVFGWTPGSIPDSVKKERRWQIMC